ncbi:MAG: cupin domain-containing protein, partial [Ruminococcaceae bacterium]|nr:cupin domain-containing protein [Oscillospiraceae bacterium]
MFYNKTIPYFSFLGGVFNLMEYLDYGMRLKKDKFTFFVSYETTIDSHSHDFLELAYVARGKIEHQFHDTTTVLQQGDYLIVDYGIEHSYRQIGDEAVCVINCLFLPEFIDKTLLNSKSFHQLIQHYLIRMSEPFTVLHPNLFVFHGDEKIKKLITYMQEEYELKQPGYLEILRGNLIELVILTMRQINIPSAKSEHSCDDIIHYVNENYSNRLFLSQLAKEM